MKQISRLILIIVLISPFYLYSQVPKPADSINKYDANHLKTGIWEERMGDLTTKGLYIANKKEKNWVTYLPNNLIYKLEYYENGMRNGIALTFDRKAKLMNQDYYKNDQLDGMSVAYSQYNETPLSEINWAGGKKDGFYKMYYDNGKLQEVTNYTQNVKDGASRWYAKTGKLIAVYNYNKGNFDGPQVTYYDNDTLESQSSYRNNKLDGDYKEYYRNGKLKVAGKYVLGLKEGTWTEYDEVGKAVGVIRYKGGVVK